MRRKKLVAKLRQDILNWNTIWHQAVTQRDNNTARYCENADYYDAIIRRGPLAKEKEGENG